MTSVLHSQLRKEAANTSLLPTVKFVGLGVLWIVVSDLLLFLTQSSTVAHFPIFHIEVFKGILFVVAMGAFFFVMQRKNEFLNREIVDLDLFKKNPQAMFIYKLDTMEFLDVNEAAVRIYGYSHEEFLMMKICDIRPAEEFPALVEAVEQLKRGQGLIGKSRHIHKNGSSLHVEVSAYSITFNKQHAGIIMTNDISNQVKAEHALIEANKLHEKQMNDKLYEVALFNKELQVRIREVNSNNDELIEVNKLLQHASRNAVARYEARIQRMQQLMNDRVENASEIFWAIDLNDNAANLVSEGALNFFGCSRKFILDMPNFWESFIHEDDKERVKNELLQLNEVDGIKIQYKHVNGKTISQKIHFMRDEDGRVEKIVFEATTPKSPKGDFGALTKVAAELAKN